MFKDVRLSYTEICNGRFEGYCEASLQVNRYKQIVQRSARSAALLGCTLCEEMKFVKVFSKLSLAAETGVAVVVFPCGYKRVLGVATSRLNKLQITCIFSKKRRR